MDFSDWAMEGICITLTELQNAVLWMHNVGMSEEELDAAVSIFNNTYPLEDFFKWQSACLCSCI
jgi:hypothetical protein